MEATNLIGQQTAEAKRERLEKYKEALPLWQETGEVERQILTLNSIGNLYSALGERQKALDYYQQALPIVRAAGDGDGEATTLNSIGLVYDSLGEKQKALEYYNPALPISRAVGDRSGEASTLNRRCLQLIGGEAKGAGVLQSNAHAFESDR